MRVENAKREANGIEKKVKSHCCEVQRSLQDRPLLRKKKN